MAITLELDIDRDSHNTHCEKMKLRFKTTSTSVVIEIPSHETDEDPRRIVVSKRDLVSLLRML